MPNILDAEVKNYESFDFVKYVFSEVNLTINSDDFRNFLYYTYEELIEIKLEKNKNIIFDNVDSGENNIQQIIFYGDYKNRKGFESIYSKSINFESEDKKFWYIFDQTVMDNFYFYFYINPESFQKDEYIITEIVVYMAKYKNKSSSIFDNLFNQTLNLIDNFLNK